MFDRLKKLRELKKMQDGLGSLIVTQEERGWKFTMNGKMELINIEIDPDTLNADSKGLVEDIVKKGINNVIKEVQKKAAQEMMKNGGLANLGI
jgi:DNA-binding protein YbaB